MCVRRSGGALAGNLWTALPHNQTARAKVLAKMSSLMLVIAVMEAVLFVLARSCR